MNENLPTEEAQELDRIAEGIARFSLIMISQKVEHEARERGMDELARDYLAYRTFELIAGDA